MKIQLIHSRADAHLIEIFKGYTCTLRNNRVFEIVSEGAEGALIFFSPALVKDVFCYQAFLTAKYMQRPMRPVLLQIWSTNGGNREFKDMNEFGLSNSLRIPCTGNYIYNADGSFRSERYYSLGQAWTLVAEGVKEFAEKRK